MIKKAVILQVDLLLSSVRILISSRSRWLEVCSQPLLWHILKNFRKKRLILRFSPTIAS
jgi:hypothetical protein